MNEADFLARQIRRELEQGGSPEYAKRVQLFFKAPVEAYGWRTEEVRKLAAEKRQGILAAHDEGMLFEVAEKLFAGPTLEETNAAVALLERSVKGFGQKEFRRLEKWLPKIGDWSGCDALCCTLLGPMVLANPRLLPQVKRWGRSRNYWHRRAAVVTLVPSARKGHYIGGILQLCGQLLKDKEYMVQKGVGWLLKEATRAHRDRVVKFLLRVRQDAPRLVLRTACEKLPQRERRRILAL
jgi:3-methyladenine DNA glycosylase AlkD